MMQEKAERFVGMDILKFLCAFLIVCIHRPFVGTAGAYFTALTRIAVPIFFMITGYYYEDLEKNHKVGRQIKKLLLLVLKANLLYLLWGMALAVLSGEGALLYLEQSLQTKNILKFLLLNVSPFGGHLWYLGAILYTLSIVCLVDKLHLRKLLYALVPFLLAGDLLLGKYALLLWGREFPYILVRNFLFVGIPYFLIGTFLRKQKIRWSTGKLFAAVLLFSLTTLLERYCLVQAQANATRDHYISTTFLACAVFLLFLRIYKTRAPGTMEQWMAHVGKDASTWIYIIHPIFISIVGVLIGRLGWNSPYGYIALFVIYAVSILVTVCLTSLLRAVPRTQYPTHMWH